MVGCNSGYPADGIREDHTDLTLGPLTYMGVQMWRTMTPKQYLGESPQPDQAGRYFYKAGVRVRAGHTVTVRVQPEAVVGLRVANITASAVRYEACPDTDTVWPGGFTLAHRMRACALIKSESNLADERTARLSLFNGRC